MRIISPISVVALWLCDTSRTGEFSKDIDGHPKVAESLSVEPTWPVRAR